jgi:hypothetical protein
VLPRSGLGCMIREYPGMRSIQSYGERSQQGQIQGQAHQSWNLFSLRPPSQPLASGRQGTVGSPVATTCPPGVCRISERERGRQHVPVERSYQAHPSAAPHQIWRAVGINVSASEPFGTSAARNQSHQCYKPSKSSCRNGFWRSTGLASRCTSLD